MQIEDCPIEGPKIIRCQKFEDSRGFFIERFHAARFAGGGLPSSFIQDNHSRSHPNVLRGLHYQSRPAQGKLVGVIRGRIWDVAVDIRPNSPTFGKYYACELRGDGGDFFWVPAGFAHGFCVLGDEPADVLYKVDGAYNKETEGGIRFDDKDLNIPWPVENPILSDRDRALPSFKEYAANPPAWGGA